MKKNNKNGCTLAELLIVVAIVAVLVAIAVPVFTAQLDRARLSTATANARSIYAEYVAECMAPKDGDEAVNPTYDGLNASFTSAKIGVKDVTVNAANGSVTVTYGTGANAKSMSFAVDDDLT